MFFFLLEKLPPASCHKTPAADHVFRSYLSAFFWPTFCHDCIIAKREGSGGGRREGFRVKGVERDWGNYDGLYWSEGGEGRGGGRWGEEVRGIKRGGRRKFARELCEGCVCVCIFSTVMIASSSNLCSLAHNLSFSLSLPLRQFSILLAPESPDFLAI